MKSGSKLTLIVVIVLLIWSYFARPIYDYITIAIGRERDVAAQKIQPTGVTQMYDDVVAINTRIVAETDAYIHSRRALAQQSPELTKLDFSSPAAYEQSTAPLRSALSNAFGFPLSDAIHGSDFSGVQSTDLGEDDDAKYTLLAIPALPGVNVIGRLIEPKQHDAKIPLIIANHGRGGMPDRPADGKFPVMMHNDRDLARGAIEHGWAVFEPIFLFWGKGYPEGIRDLETIRAQETGTTLPAIEITKLIRAIDYLTTRPEIDPDRVAMVGVSYGGFYSLYTTVFEPRIKATVVAAYFNDRAAVLDSSEATGFLDWRFTNSLGLLSDPQIVALICPRPLQIQSGNQDQLFPIEGSRRTIPEARSYYEKLHAESSFDFHDFVGRHDFNGTAAWQFIDKVFAKKP